MILSRETIAGRPARAGNKASYSKQVTDAAAREDDLVVVGVHAMLFDDDPAAGFINSPEALVPWNGDAKLLIDRYDVRHLLEDLNGLRRRRAWTPTDASEEELNHERYKDLQQDDPKDVQSTSQETPSGEKPSGGDYNSVSFDYGTDQKTSPARSKEIEEPFVPLFPVPDYLQPHMPTSQKIHQIISGTAKFVSEHGGQAEIVLRVKQSHNLTFGFLMPDHQLHLYFRYLVDHPVLTGATTQFSQPGNASLSMPAEGLRLLGEVYGGDNEEDEDSTSHGSERLAAETDGSYTHKPPAPSVQTKDLGKPVKEPPPHVKVVIGKMVEFIARNGKDFEDVVRDRDKADRRFHFLRPWNEYHPYYLKMLQNANQRNPAVTSGSGSGAISRRKPLPKPLAQGHLKGSTGNAGNLNEGKQQSSQAARGRSRFDVTPNMLQSSAPVEISHVDCTGKSPVVDVEGAGISGNDKEEEPTKGSDKEQFGMSYDAAFAAVKAATRGMRKSREKSPLALTTTDRGVQHVPANSEVRKEDSGSEGGGQVSVEAPSTDIAEEKKAERLRKAKRLAEVIRSSNDAVEIAESSEAIADRFTSGQETAAVYAGDNSPRMEDMRTEKEISDVSGRHHLHHRHHRHRDKEDYEYKIEKRKRHKSMDREANSETDSLDGGEGRISRDKRSRYEDTEATDYKHSHRSTGDEKRRHSDEKEDYEHRRKRRKDHKGMHRDDADSDDSEDNGRRDKRSKYEDVGDQKHRHRSTHDQREDKHRRRRHRKHHSSRDDKHKIHKEEPSDERGSTAGTTEISDDIRAKVRAMLLQI